MFADVALSPLPIQTARLVLAPVSAGLAQAVIAGDLSGVSAAEGWPHDGTLRGLQMAILRGHTPGWFVTLDGVVIGDCGVHSEPDGEGTVEIGFGLAAGYRGCGYGRELVGALSRWMLEQPDVRRVRARVEQGNQPSMRVLELSGFRVQSTHETFITLVLDRAVR